MTGSVFLANDRPIRHADELIDLFLSGCKPESSWGIGLEYERLPIDASTGRAAPYAGERGVESALRDLAARFGWTPELEGGHTIGLARAGSLISLEPGGQLELSARVHRDLGSVRAELARYLRETAAVSRDRGLAFVPLGLQPISRIEEIAWVPKGRYAIMAPYLAARGALAHHMMKGTAGCQLNFDYGSQEDAAEKLRVAMGVTSIVTAIFANSPVAAGAGGSAPSRRAGIWLDTDPSRCGLLELAFRGDFTFHDYLEYALDVPVIFIRRDGQWVPLEGTPFRRFLSQGFQGLRATLADWVLHLTTIFTEVRLKTYLEVRGADSVPPSLALALSALWKGLLYDGGARRAAWGLVADHPFARRVQFHRDVCERGPQAELDGVTARDLATELVAIARAGLTRQLASASVGAEGDEPGMLDPLSPVLASPGGSAGDGLALAWKRDAATALGDLLAESARSADAFADLYAPARP
ncbi:MAG: glutamate--cysteine ligase [Acidobacteria bacterium]|nr:glutamate--cysteine ligase [Acidobacteriota bacterium]